MALSPEQTDRVRFLVDDRWESWDEFDATLARMSADELHEFADKVNWDGGGADRLQRVLRHPACDRGTALMIYWRANPVLDLKYEKRERLQAEAPWRLEEWDMLRYIERRLSEPTSFATARIPYDPRNDHGDRTQQRRKKRPIPIMEEIDGELVWVGEEPVPDDPEIDVRAALPAIVFEPVVKPKNAS